MFGNAMRYELVRGRILAYAASSPEHGANPERASHLYHRQPDDSWRFEALGGGGATLQL